MADLSFRLIFQAIDRITSPVRRMAQSVNRLARTAGFERLGRAALRTGRAIGSVRDQVGRLGVRFAAFTAGFLFLFKRQMVDTAASFERFQTILETIEGSSDKARESMAWISDFAARTPFELDQLVAAFVKLRSFGFDPTTGLLTTLGDASAAMGKDIDQAVEAIADAVTGEFERLKEFGIRARVVGDQIVFEYTHNSETIRRAVQANNRAAIQETLEAIWNQKYAGAMDKLSSTWVGMMSNLSDQWTRFKLLIMNAGVFDFLTGQLRMLLDTVNRMAASGELQLLAERIGVNLVEGFRVAVEVGRALIEVLTEIGRIIAFVADIVGGWRNLLIALAGVISAQLIVALWGLTSAVWALGVALLTTPIGWFIGIVAVLAGLAVVIVENWEPISQFFIDLWADVTAAFDRAVAAISEAADKVKAAWADVLEFFESIFDGIGGFIERVERGFGGFIDRVGRGIRGIVGAAPEGTRSVLGGPALFTLFGPSTESALPAEGDRLSGRIAVEFQNAPANLRVQSVESSDDLELQTDTGFALGVP